MNRKIKVIHVFDWTYAPIGLMLSKKTGIKMIFTFALSGVFSFTVLQEFFSFIYPEDARSLLLQNEDRLKFMLKLEKQILDESSDVVFVSDYYQSLYSKKPMLHTCIWNRECSMGRPLIEDDKNSEKYHVILNGINHVDYERRVDNRCYEMPGRKDTLKVLFIGRLVMMKNITFLLETEIPEGIEIIVAGGGLGSMEWLTNTLIKNPPPRVHFVGFIRDDVKKFFLQNVDAVIVPSIHEPFGIVTLEAIASRTLLICSRSSGMEEYIGEDMCINCGIIPFTIRKALLRLLEMSKEDKLKMIDTAYTKTRHLTWNKNAEEYRQIYDKYLSV